MKSLAASAAGQAGVSIEECYAKLLDVESYPRWYPSGVLAAEALERDGEGRLTRAKTTLHVAVGPLVRDFKLHVAVRTERPTLIELRRLPKDARDREEMVVTWWLRELAPAQTRIEVDLKASLSIPPFLPVGGVADSIAGGFLAAALRALA
jgi:Polyketide cyclase / dehydrase and lipid transport